MALGFSTGELRRHLEVLQLSSRPNQYLPDLWCRASLQSLWQSEVLLHHTMSSIQTIIIVCGITNALG
jgi:hypothetical protein